MINSNLIWLKQYIKKSNISHRDEAIFLINELPYIDTLEQLYHLYYKALKRDRFVFFITDIQDEFLQKRMEVLTRISELNKITAIVESLKPDLYVSTEIKDMICLVHDILSHPKCRLYERLFGILKIISDADKWQLITNHLTAQPYVPCPEHPPAGSFNACIPLNELHASVLQLLRNNSGTYNLSNYSCTETNRFLQSLLTLYPEIHPTLYATKPDNNFKPTKCQDNSFCF